MTSEEIKTGQKLIVQKVHDIFKAGGKTVDSIEWEQRYSDNFSGYWLYITVGEQTESIPKISETVLMDYKDMDGNPSLDNHIKHKLLKKFGA